LSTPSRAKASAFGSCRDDIGFAIAHSALRKLKYAAYRAPSNGYSRIISTEYGSTAERPERSSPGRGVVLFTYAAQFALRITAVQSLPDLLKQGAQCQQIDYAEGSSPCGDPTECVGPCKICQVYGDARQRPVGCTIDHPLLAPELTSTDQLNRLTIQRMEGMGDANG
jgi:hypothetical protein